MTRVGLSAIGVCVPRGRDVGETGTRAVAAADEDTFTLAVEAVHRCLEAVEPLTVGGLFFASVSAPSVRTQVASAVATVCDLPRDVVTADFTGSARAGLAALVAASRAVAGGVRKVIVVAGDRGGGTGADGAVAAVVDGKATLARFLASAAVAETFEFQGGGGEDPDSQPLRDLAEVVERAMNEYGLGADQLSALAVAGLDDGAAARLGTLVGLDPERQLVRDHVGRIGSLCCAEPLVQLGAAIERAAAGDRVVVAAAGQGAEAVLLEATSGDGGCRPSIGDATGGGAPSPGGAPLAGGWDVPHQAAAALSRADRERATRLYGTRCAACGAVAYPAADACGGCGATSGIEPAKIGKLGRGVARGEDGALVVAVDDGGRLAVPVAGGGSAVDSIDRAVRLVLRRGADSAPLRYVWKARPA